MPNFKPKAKKKFKINKKSTMTLDSKHNEKMKFFNDIQEKQIPELLSKKRTKKVIKNYYKYRRKIEY